MPALNDLQQAARQVWHYRLYAKWLGTDPRNIPEAYSRWRYGPAGYEFRHSNADVIKDLLTSRPLPGQPPANIAEPDLIQGPWRPHALLTGTALFRHRNNPSVVMKVLTTPEALRDTAMRHWKVQLSTSQAEAMHSAATNSLILAQRDTTIQHLSGIRYLHLGPDEQIANRSIDIAGIHLPANDLTFAIQTRPRIFGDRLVFSAVLDALKSKTSRQAGQRSRLLIREMLALQFKLCRETNTVLSTAQPDLDFGLGMSSGKLIIADLYGLVEGKQAMLNAFGRTNPGRDPLNHYALTFLDKRLGLHELVRTLRTEIESAYSYAHTQLANGALPASGGLSELEGLTLT